MFCTLNNQPIKDNNSSVEIKKPKHGILKTSIKIILIIVVFYFLYKQLAANWQAIACRGNRTGAENKHRDVQGQYQQRQ